jgi:heme exporter protein A
VLPPRPLYLAHANALKEDLTAAESLRFLIHLGGSRVAAADVDAALERFGLASRASAFVRTLSQGQRRRVALARLAAERELRPWLLDEPFDALDASGIAVLAEVIVAHARRGGSVVLTSHQALPIDDPAPVIVQLHEPAFA